MKCIFLFIAMVAFINSVTPYGFYEPVINLFLQPKQPLPEK